MKILQTRAACLFLYILFPLYFPFGFPQIITSLLMRSVIFVSLTFITGTQKYNLNYLWGMLKGILNLCVSIGSPTIQ